MLEPKDFILFLSFFLSLWVGCGPHQIRSDQKSMHLIAAVVLYIEYKYEKYENVRKVSITRVDDGDPETESVSKYV